MFSKMSANPLLTSVPVTFFSISQIFSISVLYIDAGKADNMCENELSWMHQGQGDTEY